MILELGKFLLWLYQVVLICILMALRWTDENKERVGERLPVGVPMNMVSIVVFRSVGQRITVLQAENT